MNNFMFVFVSFKWQIDGPAKNVVPSDIADIWSHQVLRIELGSILADVDCQENAKEVLENLQFEFR